MWTNLGDWQDSRDYGSAARALATRVGAAAALRAGDVVVDYACGFGDSLRLWVDHFGVRRVVGVEPDPAVCETVRTRIARWGLQDRIAVVRSRAEALPPRAAAADVTAVVSVDAAYHFRSRLAWWRMLGVDLPPGARVACSDLCIADDRRVGMLGRSLARMMGIPTENLVPTSVLQQALREVMRSDVRLEPCGRSVLDGFAAHAPARGLQLRITKTSIRALRRRGLLEYAILSATVAAP